MDAKKVLFFKKDSKQHDKDLMICPGCNLLDVFHINSNNDDTGISELIQQEGREKTMANLV